MIYLFNIIYVEFISDSYILKALDSIEEQPCSNETKSIKMMSYKRFFFFMD